MKLPRLPLNSSSNISCLLGALVLLHLLLLSTFEVVNSESIRGGRRRPNYDLVHGTATKNEPLSGEEEGQLKKAVIGGVDAKSQQRPYQVSLQRTDSGVHFCGGAIIESHFILTAAHCLQSVPVNWLLIRYATLTYSSGGLTARAKRIIVHEEYDNQTVDNDIALIQTVDPLVFRPPDSLPVALPSFGSEPTAGRNITISGWGYLQEDSMRFSKSLQVAAVSVVNRDRCNAIYDGEITNNMICAESKGVDACQGDSGSPAVNHYRQIVGLVSWGIGCARPGLPGIYTKVSNYVKWISKRINNPEEVPTNWKYVPKIKPKPKPVPTKPAATNGEFLPPGNDNSASGDLLLPEVVVNATDDPSAITEQMNLANISDVSEDEKGDPAEGLTGGEEEKKKGLDMTTVYIIIILICASVPAAIFIIYYLIKKRNEKKKNDNKKRKSVVDDGNADRAKTVPPPNKDGDPSFTDPLLQQQQQPQHTRPSNNNKNGAPSPAAHPDRIEIGIERVKKEKHSHVDLTAAIAEGGNVESSCDEDDEEQCHKPDRPNHDHHHHHESTGPVDPNGDHFTGGNSAPVAEPTAQEHHFAANPPSPIYANQPYHQESVPPPVPPHATTASSRNDHHQPHQEFHSSTPTSHNHGNNDHHTGPSSYSNSSYDAAPTTSYSSPSHNSYHSSSHDAPSTSHHDSYHSSSHNDSHHNNDSHDSYGGYD